jgi:hypothetical protein
MGNSDEYEIFISKNAEHEESANRVRFSSGMSLVLVDVPFLASNDSASVTRELDKRSCPLPCEGDLGSLACELAAAFPREPFLEFGQIGRTQRLDLGEFGVGVGAFAGAEQTLDVQHVSGGLAWVEFQPSFGFAVNLVPGAFAGEQIGEIGAIP